MLPWDIIDGGMKAPFFHSEYDKSLREEWTLPPKRAQENARLLPVIHSDGRIAGSAELQQSGERSAALYVPSSHQLAIAAAPRTPETRRE